MQKQRILLTKVKNLDKRPLRTINEKILRVCKKTFVKKCCKSKRSYVAEQKVRTYVRSLAKEVAEESNTVILKGKKAKPHPSTAINFVTPLENLYLT